MCMPFMRSNFFACIQSLVLQTLHFPLVVSSYCPYPPCQLTLLQCSFQILAYLKSSHSRCVDKNVNILLLFTANTVNTVTTAISVNSTFCVLTCGKYHNCIHDMPSVTKLCFPNYFIQHGVTLLTIHKTYDHTL